MIPSQMIAITLPWFKDGGTQLTRVRKSGGKMNALNVVLYNVSRGEGFKA